MLELIPERFRTQAVARAMTSPSAIVLTGAATAAVIASGLPIVLAPVAGAVADARVAAALPKPKPGEHVSAGSIREPWRTFVRDAERSKARFDRTYRRSPPGPLKDRLASLGSRIGDGVRECWTIARHGDALYQALYDMRSNEIQLELLQVQGDRVKTKDAGEAEMLARTEAAIQAQLRSYERLHAVAEDARNRLRLLNAQLDEAVARAIELSLRRTDASELSPLSSDIDNVVIEMEHLRQALELTEHGGDTGVTGATP